MKTPTQQRRHAHRQRKLANIRDEKAKRKDGHGKERARRARLGYGILSTLGAALR